MSGASFAAAAASVASTSPDAGGTFVFNQANGTTLETIDARWANESTDFDVQSSVLRIATNLFVDRYAWFSNAQGGTQESEGTLASSIDLTSGQALQVATQRTSSTVGYTAELTTTDIILRRSGTYVNQGAHGMTLSAAGNIIRITSNSTTGEVKCYANGSQVVPTYTDGTPLTGGFPGIGMYAAGTLTSVGFVGWSDNA